MIDRWKLEHGSLKERIAQVYAITKRDLDSDPSIIELLRSYVRSDDGDLQEIALMRLGVRAKDIQSRDAFLHVLRESCEPLVRSAAIAALSSIYRHLITFDEREAREVLDALGKSSVSPEELQIASSNFGCEVRSSETPQASPPG